MFSAIYGAGLSLSPSPADAPLSPSPFSMKSTPSWSDTRAEHRRILGYFEFRSGVALLKFLGCLAAAILLASLPAYPDLPPAGRWALGIAAFSGLLWMTEAIPAFAIALLAIGLQIAILGKPGGILAAPDDTKAWEAYVKPWASSSMWLFFGGFILARSASRTGLDRSLAARLMAIAGSRPERVLLVAMATTFTFSMFLSNTATAAMMLAILGPMIASTPSPKAARSLVIGIAFAANIGGMGTIIGTPPNAIAAGLLADAYPMDFLRWTLFGLPPAIVLLIGLWWVLARMVRSVEFGTTGFSSAGDGNSGEADSVARWQRWITLAVFALTIILWLTEKLHGIPTAVVSFLPIVILSITGVIRAVDMRTLDWDILILVAGGLSLGVGVAESGLADWIALRIGSLELPAWALAMSFAGLSLLLSNFMSNTAAANILIPVGVAAGLKAGGAVEAAAFAVPMALAASTAMCLPISTPPNAIAYASGRIRTADFLLPGAIIGLIGCPMMVVWTRWVLGWITH